MASLLRAMAPLKLSIAENVSSLASAASPRAMRVRDVRSRRAAVYPYKAPLATITTSAARSIRFTRSILQVLLGYSWPPRAGGAHRLPDRNRLVREHSERPGF